MGEVARAGIILMFQNFELPPSLPTPQRLKVIISKARCIESYILGR